MRRSDAFAPVAAFVAACATPLPGDAELREQAPADASSPLAVLRGCLPFHGLPGLGALGDVRSVQEFDGTTLFLADGARVGGTDVTAEHVTQVAGHEVTAKATSLKPANK